MKATISLPAWIALGLGLVLAVLASLDVKRATEEDAVSHFAFASDQVTLKTRERLVAHALILKGGAGLFAGSGTVERAEWKAYVEKLRAEESVPGVQGIGFSQLIAPDQLAAHVARIRAEGFPDYAVRPPGERTLYSAIIYLEPFRDRNLRAFGYDMYAEPVRRAAMEVSRDSGEAALSGKVELVQETGKDVQAGTLMYVPVYRNGVQVDSIERRRAAVVGWVYSPYRMKDLMEGILRDWKSHEGKIVDLQIYDGSEATAASLLFDNHPANTPKVDSIFYQRRTIDFGGRQWLLVLDAIQGSATMDYTTAWATLLAGIALSGLLSGLIFSLRSTQAKARLIASELTEEIRNREATLKESELRYQFMFDSSPMPMYVFDEASRRFLMVNEKAVELYGFTRDEFSRMTINDIRPAEDIPALDRVLAESAGSEVSVEWRHRKKDGTPLNVVIHAVPMMYGAAPGRLVHVSDITQRKRLEEELQNQHQRLSSIIEGTNVGTWEWNVQTGETVFNQRWAEIIGYTLEELAPISIDTWLKHCHPDDLKRSGELLEKHFAGKLAYYECDARMHHKDGHWVWVLDRGKVSSWTADGKPLLMSGTHQDISRQKEYEALLVEARSQAEAANMAKSSFLATMSHEIRTPMNGILGMAQMLLSPKLEDALRQDYARTVLNSGQTLLTLLNDILDFSKVEAGKIRLESTAFEPGQIIHETRALFAEAAAAKGLAIDAGEFEPAGRRYLGDPYRLRQMLSNLVGNAIKFTKEGHIAIEAREIEHDGLSVRLEFSVTDTGIGIPASKQPLLFQPFSQTDSSTTRQYGGTGLGLSIVSSLAKLMGGEVGVTSEAGCGSRFWFRIRVSQAEAGQDSRHSKRLQTEQPDAATAPRHFSGRVLVAEDDPTNRKVAQALLNKIGLSVAFVDDGQQALDAISQGESADLILMDVHMPIMDGYLATEKIRQWEAKSGQRHRPIIALTADAFEADRQRCLAVGMDDFLAKPIALAALGDVLGKWLPADAASAVATYPAASPERPVDTARVIAILRQLEPLLERNQFDAMRSFKALQAAVTESCVAAEIDEVGRLLAECRFAETLERLRRIAAHHGWDKTS